MRARFVPDWRSLRTTSPIAHAVRQEFTAHLKHDHDEGRIGKSSHDAHSDTHRKALDAARQAVIAMRANDEIGDDAFHRIEEELDWLEMAGGTSAD